MTAVCKLVRKKTVKVLTRIKQKLNNNMSIKKKLKTSGNGTSSPIDRLI
jgi:hypothetical protein